MLLLYPLRLPWLLLLLPLLLLPLPLLLLLLSFVLYLPFLYLLWLKLVRLRQFVRNGVSANATARPPRPKCHAMQIPSNCAKPPCQKAAYVARSGRRAGVRRGRSGLPRLLQHEKDG